MSLRSLAEAMGVPVPPKSISKIWPGAVAVKTTEEMDGIFTEEDRANKNTVMIQCVACKGWTKKQVDESPPCEHCGGTAFDPTSTTSLRTFNPLTAKNRKPKGLKK